MLGKTTDGKNANSFLSKAAANMTRLILCLEADMRCCMKVWLNVSTQSFHRFLFWPIRVIASGPKDSHGSNFVIFCMTGGQTEEQAGDDQLCFSDLIFSQLHKSRFSNLWSWEQALLILCMRPYCVGHSQWEVSGTAGDKEKLQRWALYCLETRALW